MNQMVWQFWIALKQIMNSLLGTQDRLGTSLCENYRRQRSWKRIVMNLCTKPRHNWQRWKCWIIKAIGNSFLSSPQSPVTYSLSYFVPFSHSCGSMERSWKVGCWRWELQRVFSLATQNFQPKAQDYFVPCPDKLVNRSHQSRWWCFSTSVYSLNLRFAASVVPFRFTTTTFICQLETRSRSS